MNRRFLRGLTAGGIAVVVLSLIALLSSTALAQQATTHPANVHVSMDGDGAAVAGAHVEYSCTDDDSEVTVDTAPLGTTDSNGHAGPVDLTVGQHCTFTASAVGASSASQTIEISRGNNNVWLRLEEDPPVYVHASTSDGAGLAGVNVNYSCNGGPIYAFGTTDSSGDAGPVGMTAGDTCTLSASYHGTSATPQTITVADAGNTVDFQTSKVTATLSDHNGDPLSGGLVRYTSGGVTFYLNDTGSTTDGSGQAVGQMFDGTYDFGMGYNQGSQWQTGIAVTNGSTINFQTGLLSIVYSRLVSYGRGSPYTAWFTKSGTELLPGTYLFDPKGSGCTPPSIDAPDPGTTATKTILAAHLDDSTGGPLAGGNASYYHLSWKPMGTTNSSGSVCAVVDGALGNTYVAMSYNGTRQQISQNAATDSIYNFQTTDVTVQLENHTGSLIDTGAAAYYAVSWHAIGNTSGGQVHVQMLPGSYSFAMVYNGIRQQKNGVPISGGALTVTFQTALVDLHFSGTIQYIVAPGVWTSYTGPFEILPVNERFGFSGSGHSLESMTFIPTAGTVFEKTIVYTTVKASDGSGVSGVLAEWHNYGGPTSAAPGSTNTNGHLLFAIDDHPTNTNVTVGYGGATQGSWQNPQTNSFYDLQLARVTVELQDNTGTVIADASPDVTYHYYGSGEDPFGTMSGGTVSLDLLPASNAYFFTIPDYNGGTETISQHIAGNATVVFQTGKVVDDGFGVTDYHQYGKPTYSFMEPSMQLLPGNYFFNGTTLNEHVYAGQTLYLDPLVYARVKTSNGSNLAGVDVRYSCNGGPISFLGATGANGLAGPLNRAVGDSCTLYASYRGTFASQSLTVASGDNYVDFQTSKVIVTLTDHSGGPLSGGVARYKSGSVTHYLNDTGSTTDGSGQVVGELFDGTYDFGMGYNQGSQWQTGVTVSGATMVDFQTGLLSLVYSNSLSYGGSTGDSAWFAKSGTELLPSTYIFHPRGIGYPSGSGCRPVSIVSPAAGTTATKTIFAAQLADSSGAPLAGGVARYAPGGSWYSMGTTDASGSMCAVVDSALGNVKVGMTYHQAEEQKIQDVTTNSIFSFQTALGTIRLVDHANSGLAGGVVDQGGGHWDHGIATTNANGDAYVELFPGHTYKFQMDYNHLTQIKTGDPTVSPLVFQTGQLMLHYSGGIQGALGGSWVAFTKPSMELFAGTYNFRFDGYQLPMTVTEGDVNEQSVITAKLTNHLGQAIAGGAAKYAPGGTWIAMPDTNAGGWTGIAVPGTLGSVKVAMTYHQGIDELTQDQPTASFYAFQTAVATIRLIDHNGNGLSGGVVDQGGGYWDYGIATTNANGDAYVELFPGQSYKFQMHWNHTSEQQTLPFPGSFPMVFQTGAVHSDSGTATQWAGGSWYTFVQDMEILPGYYHFQFSDGTGVTYYTISAAAVNHIH